MHALDSWCEHYRSGTRARQSDRSGLWIKTRSARSPLRSAHMLCLEHWAANAVAPGEQLGVRCLAQGSHLSRGIEGGESAGYSLPPPTIPAGPEI